ncbi:MAG: hypothetical protein JW712_00570 [Dehalococcoidales bacterium]|nr:hypothetical protein [Dehalococcoidales bacterium]
MKVLDIKDIEDCFDGSLIKELLLEKEIRQDDIYALGEGNHLQYFPEFPRPFFKIRNAGLWDVKGIEGNTTMRVHLKSPDTFPLTEFVELVSGIH